jgi:MFS family permease
VRTIFRSLGIRNYRTWFIGALVSNTGFWMQRTAQDWIVLTLLTDHDAAAVGLTMALQMGPIILLLPISGYISDRFDRRTVLTFTNTAMGLLAIALGTLVVTGSVQLWHVYVGATIAGVISAIETPSKQGFVSELVTSDRISNAVSLNSASFNLARTAGPSVAAALVFLIGAGWVFYVNALTFIVMIVTIRLLDSTKLIATPRLSKWKGSLLDGVRYVRRRPDLVVVMVVAFLVGAFVLNFPIYASTMTTIEFGLGVGQYGILLSSLAVGALIGALLAASRERPRLSVIAIGATGLGFAMVVAAFMPTYWGFAALLVLAGVGVQTVLATTNATVQLTAAPEVRGRVLAVYIALVQGGTIIGAPTIGWVVNTFGPRVGILVGAFAGLLAAGILIVYLVRRKGVGLRVWRAFGREAVTEQLELAEIAARKI